MLQQCAQRVLEFGLHITYVAALKRVSIESRASTLLRRHISARHQVIGQIRSTMIGCKGDGRFETTGLGRKLRKHDITMIIAGLRGEVLEARCMSATMEVPEKPESGRGQHIQ